MKIPEELKYTKTHEWVKVEGNTAICGITDYAQSELSDIVYLELHHVGSNVKKGEAFGNIEAVKAISEIYSPVSGKIIEANTGLSNSPNIVNEDPYGKGWMVKIELSDPEELNTLLTPEEYTAFIKSSQK